MANTNIAVRTSEYTFCAKAAAALRLPVRTDISRKKLHQRLARFNRNNGTYYKLPY